MRVVFKAGDTKQFEHIVTEEDFAHFPNDKVHEVYATFALTRDAEWCTRLFVLEMKEETEEGIGTYVRVNHQSPALPGSKVVFTGTFRSVVNNEIHCLFEAHVGERLIAYGETGQKIMPKAKLKARFDTIRNGG